ncbi:MAG: hypothetical protein ACQESB_05850 [Elusimicrobiota bacterium]
MKKTYPKCKDANHIICPHGPYPYAEKDPRIARNAYKLPGKKYVLLNFGIQRPSKGLKFINKVIKKYAGNEYYLFTIGPLKTYKGRKKIIRKFNDMILIPNLFKISTVLSKTKKTVLRKVSNDEIPSIVAASDIFFLGHNKGLNSGLLALAATYEKPVVFPDIGNFEHQMSGWPLYETYQAGDVKSAVKALETMLSRISQYSPGTVKVDNKKWLECNSWDIHVKGIMEALQKMNQKK